MKFTKGNIKSLHSLAEALLEREILDSDEIEAIMRGEKLKPIKSTSTDEIKPEGSQEKEIISDNKPAETVVEKSTLTDNTESGVESDNT